MALINCPNCKKQVFDGANECPNCKCNVKERLAEIRKQEEKKKSLEQVCPECKKTPSKTIYFEEKKGYYGWGDSIGHLVGYRETTLLKCTNCGWETIVYGDEYGFLFDGADINRPGTKEHKIYKERYCQDCGVKVFQGSNETRCPACLEKYDRRLPPRW